MVGAPGGHFCSPHAAFLCQKPFLDVGASSEGVSSCAVLWWWLMWRDDGNLCFFQVKELSVEQPGEPFLPLPCSWGGLVLAGGGCGRGGLLCTGAAWWGSVTHLQPPCAPHPASQLHGLQCWAQGDGRSPWFCCSVVSGCL